MPKYAKWALIAIAIGYFGYSSINLDFGTKYQLTNTLPNGNKVSIVLKGSQEEVFAQAMAMVNSEHEQQRSIGIKFIELLAVQGYEPAKEALINTANAAKQGEAT